MAVMLHCVISISLQQDKVVDSHLDRIDGDCSMLHCPNSQVLAVTCRLSCKQTICFCGTLMVLCLCTVACLCVTNEVTTVVASLLPDKCAMLGSHSTARSSQAQLLYANLVETQCDRLLPQLPSLRIRLDQSACCTMLQ